MTPKNLAIAVALLLPAPVWAEDVQGPVPDDIWSGRHGGFPSFGASAAGGVSVELPSRAFQDAGGLSLRAFAQDFLDRWGPHMCSDIFNFQSPHKNLKVRVALIDSIPLGPSDDPAGTFFIPGPYQEISIDYQPAAAVHCIIPSEPSS